MSTCGVTFSNSLINNWCMELYHNRPQFSRRQRKPHKMWSTCYFHFFCCFFSSSSWQQFSFSIKYLYCLQSLCLWSVFWLSEQPSDPADQGLDEGVSRAGLTVQSLQLQQLPLQSLSKAGSHLALQLRTQTGQTSAKLGQQTHDG